MPTRNRWAVILAPGPETWQITSSWAPSPAAVPQENGQPDETLDANGRALDAVAILHRRENGITAPPVGSARV